MSFDFNSGQNVDQMKTNAMVHCNHYSTNFASSRRSFSPHSGNFFLSDCYKLEIVFISRHIIIKKTTQQQPQHRHHESEADHFLVHSLVGSLLRLRSCTSSFPLRCREIDSRESWSQEIQQSCRPIG